MKVPKRILPTIVLAQFCCTSLWFAGNAVMNSLVIEFDLPDTALGHLTSAVQFGFITGTLTFAILTVADRFSPSRVFLVCSLLGALSNLGVTIPSNGFLSLFLLRFATGFFLAGIYPVGMKIAADYFQTGLGKSLGFLVGALVLGTAFPHLLRGSLSSTPWRHLVIATSSLATLGGMFLFLWVPDGPLRKAGQRTDLTAFARVFRRPSFRSAAFGYFGHMWELYAFWAFVPVLLSGYQSLHPSLSLNIPLLSFVTIGIGLLSCIAGGYVAESLGTRNTAGLALALSGLCCLASPVFIIYAPAPLLIVFLIFWGIVVIADSPLFSTLVAENADPTIRGTALTIVNCIGFSITIVSIQLISYLSHSLPPPYLFVILAGGPLIGLIALFQKQPSVGYTADQT